MDNIKLRYKMNKAEELLHERIKEELSPVDTEEMYDNFLDEMHEGCELCRSYGASRLLYEVDPVAYRCGYSDYLDSLRDSYYELDDEYYEIHEVDELRDEIEAENEDED